MAIAHEQGFQPTQSVETHKKRNTLIVAVGTGAAAVAGAFGFSMLRSGGTEDRVQTNSPVAAAQPRPTESIPAPVKTPPPEKAVKNENLTAHTPQLLTAENPQILMEQLFNNLDCVFNSGIPEIHQQCRAMTFSKTDGVIASSYAGAHSRVLQRRVTEPDYKIEHIPTLRDSSIEEREAVLVVGVSEKGFDETVFKRYTLRKQTVEFESVAVENREAEAWFLWEEETLEPEKLIKPE